MVRLPAGHDISMQIRSYFACPKLDQIRHYSLPAIPDHTLQVTSQPISYFCRLPARPDLTLQVTSQTREFFFSTQVKSHQIPQCFWSSTWPILSSQVTCCILCQTHPIHACKMHSRQIYASYPCLQDASFRTSLLKCKQFHRMPTLPAIYLRVTYMTKHSNHSL